MDKFDLFVKVLIEEQKKHGKGIDASITFYNLIAILKEVERQYIQIEKDMDVLSWDPNE